MPINRTISSPPTKLRLFLSGLLALCLSLFLPNAVLADVYFEEKETIGIITLHTDIDIGDADIVERLLRKSIGKNLSVRLHLVDNIGGSVEDALKIGRMARALDLVTTVERKCFSSCALIYIGSSAKIPWPDVEIGIHRPYFDTSSSTQKPTQSTIEDLFNEVSMYLSEVKAPSFLLEVMMNTAPNSMRVYTNNKEIEELFGQIDPVLSELKNIHRAARYGISMLEYLSIDRKSFFEYCWHRHRDLSGTDACMATMTTAAYWGYPASLAQLAVDHEKIASDRCQLNDVDRDKLNALVRELKTKSLNTLSSQHFRSIFNEPLFNKERDCIIRVMNEFKQ